MCVGEQGDVRPYAKFLVDAVRSNKDAKDTDELVKVRCVSVSDSCLLQLFSSCVVKYYTALYRVGTGWSQWPAARQNVETDVANGWAHACRT